MPQQRLLATWLTFFLCVDVGAAPQANTSIIFLIGDGMGVAYTSAYRLYSDNPATSELDKTIFDETLVGMSSTHPDDHSLVTDSAAAATALACGIKTFNGAIGVGPHHQVVASILDKAKLQGYLTGIVVTSQVNHATPAAFVAHADSRQSYDKIADQYVDAWIHNKPKVDVIFGGGQDYFIRKDRNLIKELGALGYSYEPELKKISSIKEYQPLGYFPESEWNRHSTAKIHYDWPL